MKTFLWSDMDTAARDAALARPEGLSDPELIERVREIMAAVKTGGDKAVMGFTRQFDGVKPEVMRVPESDLETAWSALDKAEKDAIIIAQGNIERFHAAQMPTPVEVETMPGVVCRREVRALETVGLYVPGGTAPLVSTLMMLAIPAAIAGVSRRVVVTPPDKDGFVNQAIMAAAYRCGVSDVFICGGAQAIAALAYGSETIPRCDKIFGPGNTYVAIAKSLASQEPGGPAIDMPAGPSEAMVAADATSNPAFVASDLLSQAEHDTLAQVMCICSDTNVAKAVQAEIRTQLSTLPRREIAETSLSFARFIVADSENEILEIINRYAPEHLILHGKNPRRLVPDIRNAGSIFLGPWTPESVGDYASGTNHTLPTFGAARAYSGITLESFMKYISIQELTRDGLATLGPTVEQLATMEGLDAHKRAVSLRLQAIENIIQSKAS